ncbi:MAG TPA: hypothetical protein VKB89_19070 [Xanthobacteraceae bacterium]|nr:hypothetical protein [Xanthobacteraceae bacterium]
MAFAKIGAIDFIVAGALTSSPTTQADIQGEAVLLETIPEIITKKIYYRGPIFSTLQQQASGTEIKSLRN